LIFDVSGVYCPCGRRDRLTEPRPGSRPMKQDLLKERLLPTAIRKFTPDRCPRKSDGYGLSNVEESGGCSARPGCRKERPREHSYWRPSNARCPRCDPGSCWLEPV
jgi:hypothetical protein